MIEIVHAIANGVKITRAEVEWIQAVNTFRQKHKIAAGSFPHPDEPQLAYFTAKHEAEAKTDVLQKAQPPHLLVTEAAEQEPALQAWNWRVVGLMAGDAMAAVKSALAAEVRAKLRDTSAFARIQEADAYVRNIAERRAREQGAREQALDNSRVAQDRLLRPPTSAPVGPLRRAKSLANMHAKGH